MLYDLRWEVKTKPDVLSLEGLIAWLEAMPAAKAYDYDNCHGKCLYGLYMASHGFSWIESGGAGATTSTPERSRFCDEVYSVAACERPWTFGAALDRARKALGK